MSVLDKVLRAGEGRKYKKVTQIAARVNDFEPEIKELTDAELLAKTAEFRSRLEKSELLDDLLPEAFAVVREAAWRSIGQRHFDVQVIGGTVLHQGAIAEMKTGEGKTLASTMPIYLNALPGEGVHVVTANPYLAKRDAEWMGQVFRFLGLTVGLIQPQGSFQAKREAYGADITYGTSSEFGFDFLRDNLALSLPETVQRGHHFSIVDEVDSILIDEARTPLIISGQADESAKWYKTFATIVPKLKADEHYEVDEAKRTVAINEEGIARVETLLGVENLYDQVQTHLVHYLDSALRAKELYKRDRDYIVQDRKVVIVDQFTGRTMPSRRWSDGLHQAVEAKEKLVVQEESVTEATVTIQKYFQMYDKLSGMTGTAMTQAAEFASVYNLDVYEIPTNRNMSRIDQPDLVYKTEDAKWKALTEDLVERNANGQPCLVGTVDVAKSEKLAGYLDRRGVKHEVLNAKNHEREAFIVAQAGRIGAVVVATNMAGRGVDILLGGNAEYLARQEMSARGWDNDEYLLELMNDEDKQAYEAEYEPILEQKKIECAAEHEKVVELGGLYVLGTERHESRRIDNQLRGRSGRQGDPGESRFYLSLEDDLMRFFATGMINTVMDKMSVPDDQPIEAKMVSKAIERAQSQVESQNFEIRKNLLKYDEVLSKQREEVYRARRSLLEGEDLSERAEQMLGDVIEDTIAMSLNPDAAVEDWDWEGLDHAIAQLYPSKLSGTFDTETVTYEAVVEAYLDEALAYYAVREEEIGEERFRELERLVLLSILNARWREHLYEMDQLREGIGLRAYGQRDPLTEYQREGFDMFGAMMDSLKEEFVRYMFHVQVVEEPKPQPQPVAATRAVKDSAATALQSARAEAGLAGTSEGIAGEPARTDKVPRNAPCPCGSGKKYKLCHGRDV
ncbi:MAG TPA: preprotein translocase subunit SecA [Actinomycetota bacterium]|jgi:preprotein translocase subunit SecA|nr:preprotein translocase subunit SecA [Actinomycetota bacterium]